MNRILAAMLAAAPAAVVSQIQPSPAALARQVVSGSWVYDAGEIDSVISPAEISRRNCGRRRRFLERIGKDDMGKWSG